MPSAGSPSATTPVPAAATTSADRECSRPSLNTWAIPARAAFTQSGGTNNAFGNVSPGLYLGYKPGSSGSYSLSGPGVFGEFLGYIGFWARARLRSRVGRTPARSSSATTQVPTGPTTSAAQDCSPHPRSSWAAPARARSFKRVDRTWFPISRSAARAAMRLAAARSKLPALTFSTKASSLPRRVRGC